MTCVSGYDITKKRVPTGLKVTTKEVDLCETVRKVLGQSQGNDFIKSSNAICQCFPRLEELKSTANFKSLSQGVISTSNAKAADEILSLQKWQCLQDGGLSLQSNSSEVKSSIQSGNDFTNVQGFEMDEMTHAKLIAGIKSCQKGDCNSTLITETIQYIFRMSSDVEGRFKGSLDKWQTILSDIESVSTSLNDLLPKFTSYAASAQVQFDSINGLCQKSGSCTGPYLLYFLQLVGNNIVAAKYFGKLQFPSDLRGNLETLLGRIDDTSNQIGSLDDTKVVALFKSNKIKSATDLFQILPMIKSLKSISTDIKTRLDPFQEVLPHNQTFAITTITKQQKLLSLPLEDIEEGLGSDQHELIEKLSAMRQLIAESDNDHNLTRFIEYLGSLQGELNSLITMIGTFAIETKVVNNKLWSKLPGMAIPCSRKKTKTYKDSGFTEVFSYPEYFKCMVDGAIAAFPDRQMGYVRITS
ncbi:hypothetical protein NW768_011160 [Fusarium equiseti]|uniref:Uncharacterized protein n=1 Tax=Fusarium equiseti TaxID=61235 RepID=A0ABQ8QYL9_FUSEQ|nr:hypothetical protein NW768_011160 [Fusarium equiseti]